MAGLPNLSDLIVNLTKRAVTLNEELERVKTNSRGLPSPEDLAARAGTTTTTPERERTTVVSDGLPPQTAPKFRTFGARRNVIGNESGDDTAAASSLSADEYLDRIGGDELRKLLEGYGAGGTDKGGQAFLDALSRVEEYARIQEKLRSEKLETNQRYYLQQTLRQMEQFFQRVFGPQLGSISALARELEKFKNLFPAFAPNTDPSTWLPPQSGNASRSTTTTSSSSSSTNTLRLRGGLR